MVKVVMHHGGSISKDNAYVGGYVENVGRVHVDYLTVPDLQGVVKGCGYVSCGEMYCTLDDEESIHMKPLQRDTDVLAVTERIVAQNSKTLHIYVKHPVDIPVVMGPGEGGGDDGHGEGRGDDSDGEGVGDEGHGEGEGDKEAMSDFNELDDADPDWSDSDCNSVKVAAEQWFKQWSWGSSRTGAEGEVESDYASSEEWGSLDEPEQSDGDGEVKRRRPMKKSFPNYKETPDLRAKVTFEVGEVFQNCEQFKRALRTHCIQEGFEYSFVKNDKLRVRVVCKLGCGWEIYLGQTRAKDALQIKTYNAKHTCGSHHTNKKASVKWLAHRYLENFKDDPSWTPSALRGEVAREYLIDVRPITCCRARRMALRMIYGEHAEQYKHLVEYGLAIKEWSPGSSFYLKREGSMFQRMYVCLAACKEGFLKGCRPIISVDGCFLKGEFGGQLLAAIGKDANDDIFPIAYAACESECRDSWTWFLSCLLEDIGSVDDHGWTFMSDRQKGLLQSFDNLMPGIEHRMCIRHLHANFKNEGYKGKPYKDALWAAACASNETAFNQSMLAIKRMDEKAHHYLFKLDVRMWSRHAFNWVCKSDMLLNNLAESFNAWIREARDKPILTMLDIIRRQIMIRFQSKRDRIRASTNQICPKIVKKLERSKTEARNWVSRWRSELTFEVDHGCHPRRVVDLNSRECTCGRWQLNGIPCPHACVAIYFNKEQPEDYVHKYYHMSTYAKAYAPEVTSMPGPENWPQHEGEEIQPPILRRQPGRPRKNRSRAPDENEENPTKLSQRGYVITCGNCGAVGLHNARRCPEPENPNKKKWPKRVRKRKDQATPTEAGDASEEFGGAEPSRGGDESAGGTQQPIGPRRRGSMSKGPEIGMATQ